MRDLALAIILLGIIPLIFYRPHVGVLAWAWVAFMNPHRETYSYLQNANLNLFITILTIASLFFSQEKRLPRLNPTLAVMITFMVWTTLTTYTALNYDQSYPWWLVNTKSFVLALFVAILINNPSRVHSLILIIVISLGYWGIVDGLRTLLTFGHWPVEGPAASMISDNNTLALALVMILPLIEYCRHVTLNVWIRYACILGIVLTLLTILGTYSRGGLIALGAALALFAWKAKRRLLAGAIFAIPLGLAIVVFPQQWSERMGTIQTRGSDQSYQTRLENWKTALRMGQDRPLVGVGYRGIEVPSIFASYDPDVPADSSHPRAAHSAYFQVLSDHGFVGLGLFGLMFVMAVLNCRWVRKTGSTIDDLNWLAYLASMLEIGFIGYAVGAAALSVAYYDVFLVLIVVSSLLRDYAQREVKALDKSGKQRALQTMRKFAVATSKS
jgi:putative inorganic carbon (hco3(-)) transporter